jgi:hypothetical protein
MWNEVTAVNAGPACSDAVPYIHLLRNMIGLSCIDEGSFLW